MRPENSLVLVVVLNLVDLVSTITLIAFGLCYEANPVMSLFLGFHPLAFSLAKLSLVYAGIGFLYHHLDNRVCRVGCHLSAVVYLLVMLQHARVISQTLVA